MSPKSQKRSSTPNKDRLGRLSLEPVSVDDALRSAMQVPTSDEAKPKRRRKTKKQAKRKKKGS